MLQGGSVALHQAQAAAHNPRLPLLSGANAPRHQPSRQQVLKMITQLKFVGIPTRDQSRALKFYTELLGFEVSTDQPFNDHQRWIELRIANSATRVVLFTPEGHESRIGTFFNGSFACDDVQATYRQLSARGVEFVKPPEKQPWGEFAIFKDPDGNQFVLSSS
jgi:predicted enzyme related to lactoylglutathione lyase